MGERVLAFIFSLLATVSPSTFASSQLLVIQAPEPVRSEVLAHSCEKSPTTLTVGTAVCRDGVDIVPLAFEDDSLELETPYMHGDARVQREVLFLSFFENPRSRDPRFLYGRFFNLPPPSFTV